MRRDVPERNAIAHGYDLSIYAANARVETLVLLLARLELPAAQHVWDRHLVVYLHAAIDAYPKMLGKLIRECRRLEDRGETVVDSAAVVLAHKSYKKEMAKLPKDFTQTLEQVRNTVGAHHLDNSRRSDASGLGINGLIDSVEAQIESDARTFEALSGNALRWSMRAMECGRAAFAGLHVLDLPEIPDTAEYRRLVSELDAEQDQQSLRFPNRQ